VPDRVIKESLLDNERWCDLGDPQHRLCYLCLLLVCDDYGNVEINRKLYKKMRDPVSLERPASMIPMLVNLASVGLIDIYSAVYSKDTKHFIHIYRFHSTRTYWSRKCPQAPFESDPRLTSFEIKNKTLGSKSASDKGVISVRPATDLQQTCAEGLELERGRIGFIYKEMVIDTTAGSSYPQMPVDNFDGASEHHADIATTKPSQPLKKASRQNRADSPNPPWVDDYDEMLVMADKLSVPVTGREVGQIHNDIRERLAQIDQQSDVLRETAATTKTRKD
jgi:hypothetical protein